MPQGEVTNAVHPGGPYITSMRRMLAQLWAGGAEFLSNFGDKGPIPSSYLIQRKTRIWRAFAAFTCNLLQSKVSYG